MGGFWLIVLDTHVLLWLDAGDPRLAAPVRKVIDGALARERLAVSAISFWEAAMLAERGRIRLGQNLTAWRLELLRSGLSELPVDGEIGILAASLPDAPADPADRIIIATAARQAARLVTADQRILDWPGQLRRLAAG